MPEQLTTHRVKYDCGRGSQIEMVRDFRRIRQPRQIHFGDGNLVDIQIRHLIDDGRNLAAWRAAFAVKIDQYRFSVRDQAV